MSITFGDSVLPGFNPDPNGDCPATQDADGGWSWSHAIGACDTKITRSERFVEYTYDFLRQNLFRPKNAFVGQKALFTGLGQNFFTPKKTLFTPKNSFYAKTFLCQKNSEKN